MCYILWGMLPGSFQKPSVVKNGRWRHRNLPSQWCTEVPQEFLWGRFTCLACQGCKNGSFQWPTLILSSHSVDSPSCSLKRIFICSCGSALRAWFTGATRNYLNMLWRMSVWGVEAASCRDTCWWNNSCTERRWIIFLKLVFCFMEYSSHLRLCFAYFSCLATDPLWSGIGLLEL